MNLLSQEIVALIDKLELSNPLNGSTERITTSHLKGLMAAILNAEDSSSLETRFADLEHFWASSVAWCSELSKDLEKIIIMYRELL